MNIIGQKMLLNNIDRLINDNNFPRYTIIQGALGSGKKLISSYIANKLNALFVPCDISVNSVREVIDTAYTQTEPIVYMWANADKMSLAAKNAVLKVTEEPPQNAYFIMTTETTDGLLGTLISRGYVLNMLPYTLSELAEFAKIKAPNLSSKELSTVVNISTTPYDILKLSAMNISQLDKAVTTFCDRIGQINLANELKISTLLKFKEDEEDKFDPIIFMRACMFRFSELMINDPHPLYGDLVSLTSKYLNDMNSKSLNKVCTVDTWIIDLHLTANGGV